MTPMCARRAAITLIRVKNDGAASPPSNPGSGAVRNPHLPDRERVARGGEGQEEGGQPEEGEAEEPHIGRLGLDELERRGRGEDARSSTLASISRPTTFQPTPAPGARGARRVKRVARSARRGCRGWRPRRSSAGAARWCVRTAPSSRVRTSPPRGDRPRRHGRARRAQPCRLSRLGPASTAILRRKGRAVGDTTKLAAAWWSP